MGMLLLKFAQRQNKNAKLVPVCTGLLLGTVLV